MKYLFFDLEYASCKGGRKKICEFGYVVTNEHFNILSRGNFIINPNILRKDWDWYAVRKILTKDIKTYENGFTFEEYYDEIIKIINSVDYVIGHSLNGDAEALNHECERYNLPSIDFTFYDVKNFYKAYSGISNDRSVGNVLIDLNVEGEPGAHDAEVDSVNTMIAFKTMLSNLEMSIEELKVICPEVEDINIDFQVQSLKIAQINNQNKFEKLLNGDTNNLMKNHSKERKLFYQFIDNVLPTIDVDNSLSELVFSISINYEETHFKQMFNIVQLLCNKGAKYTPKATEANYFVTFEMLNEDGTLKKCTKHNYVNDAISKGANIKIISFNELLNLLDITEQELNEMPMVSFDCLRRDDAIIKDYRSRKYFQKEKQEPDEERIYANIGTLFSELLLTFN